MADAKKPEGKAANGKSDRRRLSYLKIRGQELRKELQANKQESDALRKKLGAGPKKKKGGDEDDDE
jgi:hypothetical protein